MPKAKLLLIEDNPRIQLANKDMLEMLGYEVAIAMNLAEARACLSAQKPDVAVLDIMLPDGSGLDFLRELRRIADLPVLMLTALRTTEDIVRGLSLGTDDYLAKPYAYPVLAARVDALLRRSARVPETLTKGALRFDLLANQTFLSGGFAADQERVCRSASSGEKRRAAPLPGAALRNRVEAAHGGRRRRS